MTFSTSKRTKALLLLTAFLLAVPILCSAAGPNDLLGKKEVDEEERKQTIERIESIQEKLQLLQDKLRVLERRKAAKIAAERAQSAGGAISDTPVQVNWAAVDETTANIGEYGLYTYLLFNGNQQDQASIGLLEDFILTIETLPAHDIPEGLANRFLVPVEKPQSLVSLGRQPYDFKLNQAYLNRLGIKGVLPSGPVLVSLREPVDPYGVDQPPAYLAVALGHQAPQRNAELAGLWHRQEKASLINPSHPLADVFWPLIDGIGPVEVSSHKGKITVALPQQ